ncbi:hypothetical protein ACIO3O_18890 [Streptomyces sp. NPDC087440]|uniref:hypothetical protein n=1 Tax=Streptomyces sp. NPDC087440 TaxID=3365790 RepID=UPI00380F3372
MSPTVSSAPAPAAPSTATASYDERFALLLARTGLDAELGARFAETPGAVLDQYGLGTAAAPRPAAVLTVEELDGHDAAAMLPPTWRCRTDAPKPVKTPVESQ